MGETAKQLINLIENWKEDEEIKVVEKCLNLFGPDKNPNNPNIPFILLTRCVQKLSPSALRTLQSRFFHRLAILSDKHSNQGILFAALIFNKYPRAREIHLNTGLKIIKNTIDNYALIGEGIVKKQLRKVLPILFTSIATTENVKIMTNTLDCLLRNVNISQVAREVLPLENFGVKACKVPMMHMMLSCLSKAYINTQKNDIKVDRKPTLETLELAISTSECRQEGFECLSSLIVGAKYSLMPLINRIVSFLISDLANVDQGLLGILCQICETYGSVTSTLYNHFYVLFTALKQPIHSQNYAVEAAHLLSLIVKGGAHVIRPEVLLTVQKSICENSLRHPDSPIYHEILCSFIALNCENVPIPVHIGREVSSRSTHRNHYLDTIDSLCQLASRPRTTDIAIPKTMKNVVIGVENTINDPIMEVDEVAPTTPAIDDIPVGFEADGSGNVSEESEEEEEEEVVVIPVENTRKKKTSESSTKAPAPKKVRRDSIKEKPTELLDGEASVDDILNLFDLS